MSYLVCAFGRVLGFLCGLFSKLLIGDFKVNLYLVTAADLYAINQTGQNHVFGLYKVLKDKNEVERVYNIVVEQGEY